MYDDPDLGVVALSEPQGHPKQLNVDPNIRGEIMDLCEKLTFDNKTKLVLLLSFSTNEMIKQMMIILKYISWIVLEGLTVRRENA